MAQDADVLAAVRRKLNVTWHDEATDARIADVAAAVATPLALRCGLAADHEFTSADPEWALYLNACLYEFSDALDDFWSNYASELAEAHWRNTLGATADA